MAHGFIIKCEKCGSEDCRVETTIGEDYVHVTMVCDNCGQVE